MWLHNNNNVGSPSVTARNAFRGGLSRGEEMTSASPPPSSQSPSPARPYPELQSGLHHAPPAAHAPSYKPIIPRPTTGYTLSYLGTASTRRHSALAYPGRTGASILDTSVLQPSSSRSRPPSARVPLIPARSVDLPHVPVGGFMSNLLARLGRSFRDRPNVW